MIQKNKIPKKVPNRKKNMWKKLSIIVNNNTIIVSKICGVRFGESSKQTLPINNLILKKILCCKFNISLLNYVIKCQICYGHIKPSASIGTKNKHLL